MRDSYSLYHRDLPKAEKGKEQVFFERDSPGFNGYFKWYKMKNGLNPKISSKGLKAPADWKMPSDWFFSDITGHWYTKDEAKNAGYVLQKDEWLHPNEIRRRKVEAENRAIDERIRIRGETDERMRGIHKRGRGNTILTTSKGDLKKASIERKLLARG